MARDRVVKGWKFAEDLGEVDTDYGSGYPNGNRNNQQLLQASYNEFVRNSFLNILNQMAACVPLCCYQAFIVSNYVSLLTLY